MKMNHILRGKVRGDLEWDERSGKTYEIHLDVPEKFQRQGIGRSMLRELEDLIRERDGMSIYTYSAADNTAAKGFFLAMGFTRYLIVDFYGVGRDAHMWVKVVGTPK